MKVALFAAIAAVAGSAHAAQRFDLVCQVDREIDTVGSQLEKHPHEARRLRVDLDAKLWCDADCSDVKPLVRSDAQTIVFLQQPQMTSQVSRLTGAYLFIIHDNDARPGCIRRMSVSGTCVPATFTGFPSAKF